MCSKYKFNDALVAEIRDRFINVESDPVSGKRIYFENAGGTLKLKSVLKTIEFLTAFPDNTGRLNKASKVIDQAIEKGRSSVALFLGAESGRIIAEQSATGMIFRLLNTIAANVGRAGNIVTSNLDHASIYDANNIISQRHGLKLRIAEMDPIKGNVPVESVLKHIDSDTIALSIIHASNILGTRNDVTEIVREVRKINPETFIILDGSQHASHGLIDVEEYGADAYMYVPYKTYSKIGCSFAHLSERLATLSHDRLLGKPDTFWDLGTREPASYACMTDVVEYMQWLGSNFTDSDDPRELLVEGMCAIEHYEYELMKTMLHGTGKINGLLNLPRVAVYGEKENLENREAIIAFTVDGIKTVDLINYFSQDSIILHNRVSDAYSKHTLAGVGVDECIRVSLCHYNSMQEVVAFLKCLNQIVEG